MLANNLQTTGVTKYQQTSGGGQQASQYVRLQLGSTNASQWLVRLKQAGADVTTESIGAPTDGYVRYSHITTSQKHADGKPYDFSSITGVWGKTDTSGGSSLTQLFSQSLLDVGTAPVPPIGNLQPDHRQDVLKFIHDQSIFTPDYSSVKREQLNGRPVYVYTTKVALVPYVRMMQAFARDLGLHSLDNVDASAFQSSQPVTLVLKVDVWSHQLREVSYPEANFTESYSDYGLVDPIQIPTHTIPVNDLQTRLRNLQ